MVSIHRELLEGKNLQCTGIFIHNFIQEEGLSDEFFSLYDQHEVHDSRHLQKC